MSDTRSFYTPASADVSKLLTPFIQLIVISSILYGASLIQVYNYASRCNRDPVWTKLFVALIFFLETVCTGLSLYILHRYTVMVIVNPFSGLMVDWSICATPIFINLVHILVSSYYVSRMWLYNKSKVLGVGAMMLVIARAVAFAYAEQAVCQTVSWIDVVENRGRRISIITAMAVAPVTDAIVAIGVSVPLYRSLPQAIKMKDIVTSLLVMTLNTGSILVAISLCCLILYVALPDSLAWGGILLISGKLYANSLFAMLNGRVSLRSKLDDPTARLQNLDSITIDMNTRATIKPISVVISKETYTGGTDVTV